VPVGTPFPLSMVKPELTTSQKIKQNHALEHAVMHVLARRVYGLHLVAHSDWAGFTVFGEIPLPVLESAVTEALKRMRSGEVSLAIHPHCGTNIAVPLGLCGGLVIGAASLPRGWRVARLLLILLAGFFFAARKPLSSSFQRYMTNITDLEQIQIKSVRLINNRGLHISRVSIGS